MHIQFDINFRLLLFCYFGYRRYSYCVIVGVYALRDNKMATRWSKEKSWLMFLLKMCRSSQVIFFLLNLKTVSAA